MSGVATLVKQRVVVDQDGTNEQTDDSFDRDAVLAKLFALPLPPHPHRGSRPYPIHTPLGRLMRLRNLMIRDVTKHPGAPNERVMTELLAGRREVRNYRVPLAKILGVDPRVL